MPAAHSNRWVLLVTVAAGLLLIVLDNSVLYTALPTLTRELGATATQGLWIINAYPLVMAGLLLGTGTLGDRIGHRRMFLIGLVLFGVASIVAAYSPTAEILNKARPPAKHRAPREFRALYRPSFPPECSSIRSLHRPVGRLRMKAADRNQPKKPCASINWLATASALARQPPRVSGFCLNARSSSPK